MLLNAAKVIPWEPFGPGPSPKNNMLRQSDPKYQIVYANNTSSGANKQNQDIEFPSNTPISQKNYLI